MKRWGRRGWCDNGQVLVGRAMAGVLYSSGGPGVGRKAIVAVQDKLQASVCHTIGHMYQRGCRRTFPGAPARASNSGCTADPSKHWAGRPWHLSSGGRRNWGSRRTNDPCHRRISRVQRHEKRQPDRRRMTTTRTAPSPQYPRHLLSPRALWPSVPALSAPWGCWS